VSVDREYHDDWKSGGTGQRMIRQFRHWARHLYVHDPEFDAAFRKLVK
jgi:hypothetical protein